MTIRTTTTRKRTSTRNRSCWQLALALFLLATPAIHASSSWDQPAAQLAAQIASILGAGQAQLQVNNRSTITAAEIPPIRHLLEQNLRNHGVAVSGAESANLIRVTLSENSRQRVWVAEIVEGSQTQVAMVQFDRDSSASTASETGLILEKKRLWNSSAQDGPILAAFETRDQLVVLETEQIVFLTRTPTGWQEQNRWNLGQGSGQIRPQSRDPRGLLTMAPSGDEFAAVTPGRACTGNRVVSSNPNKPGSGWNVFCQESDDPWPVGAGDLHAFYNASRNFYTGVLAPSQKVELEPFYSIAALSSQSPDNPAILVNGVDGKVRRIDGNSSKQVSGTRDWGSDFAAIHTGCGPGMQLLASTSGEARNDSLRAYELSAQEAIAVSAPLEMDGAVTALWTSQDSTVWAVVRRSANEYEVDRVTALCQ